MKPVLKTPGTKLWKLEYRNLLSTFAFISTGVATPGLAAAAVQRVVEAVGCSALPRINGAPATVSATATSVDLTESACGVPGILALTGALSAIPNLGALPNLRHLALGGTALGAEVEPSRHCSPRHGTPFKPRNEDS